MPITNIYRFNQAGLKEFSKFIQDTIKTETAGGVKLKLPPHATDTSLTELVSGTTSIDSSKTFLDRYAMADYLTSSWTGFSDDQYDDIGVWAWLAALYFDQLRRKKGTTQRQEHFIPDRYAPAMLSQNLDYRHSVYLPFFLKSRYEDDFCKFILSGRPVCEMGDPCENCCGNKKIMSSQTMRGLMCELYLDKTKLSVKSGAFTKPDKSNRKSTAGRGGAQRMIPIIIPRLKKSYDVEDMPVNDIISASGSEIQNSKWTK